MVRGSVVGHYLLGQAAEVTGSESVRIYHLDCGSGRPWGARVFSSRFAGHMVSHCVLVVGPQRLVLVDTGLSEAELRNPRALGWFGRALGFECRPELAARRQLQSLGLDPDAVTDVVVTHLDLDHAGGLQDFPKARVHVPACELEAALRPRTLSERQRYRPSQWMPHRWQPHTVTPEHSLHSPAAVLEVENWSLSYISLFGHTRGHCGVLLRSVGRLMLHCGDAYYDRSELSGEGSYPFQWFKRMVDVSYGDAVRTRRRVRELVQDRPNLEYFCAHDPREFDGVRRRFGCGARVAEC